MRLSVSASRLSVLVHTGVTGGGTQSPHTQHCGLNTEHASYIFIPLTLKHVRCQDLYHKNSF